MIRLRRAGMIVALLTMGMVPAHHTFRQGPTPWVENDSSASEASKATGGIQWFATWESAKAEAKRTGRPILLVSAAPHCAGVSGIW